VANLSSALAADDLSAFEKGTAGLHAPFPELPADSTAEIRTATVAFDKARHLPGKFDSLATARAAFLPLSEAAADLVLTLKSTGTGATSSIVFACPMTDNAFPGAPSKARWIQSGKPLRNPWFGASMAECGAEIQPPARP